MHHLLKPFQLLYLLYFYAVFVSLFIISFPFSWLALRNPGSYGFAHLVRSRFSRLFLFLVFIFPLVKGRKNIKSSEQYIYLSNHTSLLDIVVMLALFPQRHHYMPKKELGKFPVFGIYFGKMDIAVDRSSVKGARRAFEQADEQLEEGHSLVIYPEGGIPKGRPILGKFKTGPFRLAIKHQVAVVPMSFPDHSKMFYNDGLWFPRPGITRLNIHPPIMTREMNEEDQQDLSDKVFDIIYRDLQGR